MFITRARQQINLMRQRRSKAISKERNEHTFIKDKNLREKERS